MDVSVVAAVGSFVVSERVLKPKATALFILGCILAYDLTTKTHDVSSLRVYRGPALLAVTLMMCAYSLRTWRRNGIACDELLFLPGTAHGQNHGIEGPLVEMPPVTSPAPAPAPSQQQQQQQQQQQSSSSSLQQHNNTPPSSPSTLKRQFLESSNKVTTTGSSSHLEGDAAGGFASLSPSAIRQRRVMFEDGSISSSGDRGGDDDPLLQDVTHLESSRQVVAIDDDDDDEMLTTNTTENGSVIVNLHDDMNNNELNDDSDNNNNNNMKSNILSCRSSSSACGGNDDDDDDNNNNNNNNSDQQALLSTTTTTTTNNVATRFRDNHPRITRIGTFFFFRSSPTSTTNAAYAPSGPSVFGAALDLSMPILFNFHLFIEAYNHIQSQGSEAPAKILPIIFLSVLIVRTVVPPSRRGRFWSTLKFTFAAPFHYVRFRDDFIGDILTSLVRPGQDILFALSYYFTVIFGTITGRYGLTESGQILEESWLLHNVILPSAAIIPLWWKYLQTLRQAYDTNRRWPYQGNSIKYLSATLVIIYGMTHPEDRRSSWWIVSFFITLLYQLWWDVIMDWDLFELKPRDFNSHLLSTTPHEQDPWCATHISSLRPTSHILLSLQLYLLQPMLDLYQRIKASIPSWKQIQLRPKRLYKTESFYWKIFFVNIILRSTWMVCFIPAYHFVINKDNDGENIEERKVVTSSSDVNSYWGVLLPIAEIFRRTLWGFLRLEKETIKMMDSDIMYSRVDVNDDSNSTDGGNNGNGNNGDNSNSNNDEYYDDDSSKEGVRSSFRQQLLPTWLDVQQQVAHDAATSNSKQRERFMRQLFVAELYIWAAAFVLLGCWVAS